jgi:hypothetical protein
MKITSILAGAALALAALNAQAVLMVFTDRTGWETAITGTIATEDFNGVTPFAMSTGVNSAGLIAIGLTGGSTDSRIDDGSGGADIDGSNYFHGALDGGGSLGFADSAEILTSPTVGFGADWTTTITGGLLTLTILGETVQFDNHLSGIGNGFLGVVSTVVFSSILLDTETGAAEQFGMDNFSLAFAMPEPATAALLGVALGLAGWKKRA